MPAFAAEIKDTTAGTSGNSKEALTRSKILKMLQAAAGLKEAGVWRFVCGTESLAS